MIDVTFLQVSLGYVFVIILLIILKRQGIKRERLLLYASIRMTLQLVLVGYVLIWLFDIDHPLLTMGIVCLMIGFAIYTLFRKFKGNLSKRLKWVIALCLPLGGLPVLFYFLWVVIGIEPLFNPQYVIPITGMIIGNSMTGISLGLNQLLHQFKDEQDAVVTHLLLGATQRQATKTITNHAFDQAIMPTLNSMLGMGIIFLPGMMTGQILSGIVPTTAILYQIAIMLGILGSVSLTTYLVLIFGIKTFFNAEEQIIMT
ncbi:MAG: ABC transporter permease [Acholeplasmataceae bacterium]